MIDYPLATTNHIGRGETDNGQYDQAREVQFVTGAALAMWREVGQTFHFFDEEYFPLYYEDVDLCRRLQREGLRAIYQPEAVAYHAETVTLNRESSLYYSYYHVNRLRYVVKQYTPEQVMLDFLPAEAARVTGDMAPEDRKASLALLDNSKSNGSEAQTQHKLDTMQGHMAEVMRSWRVRERPFTSSVPLLGGLVVSLRKRLNNLSTRWYVQAILQQQVAELQARAGLQGIMTAGLASRWSNTSLEDLTNEIETLRARIEQLEREIVRVRDHHNVIS